MVSFIKLNNIILNTRCINKVIIEPNMFYIYLMNNRRETKSVYINSQACSGEEEIKICAKSNPDDFNKIKRWIHYI